ncbi:MAG: hypothetical protein UY41_C0057G0008 [Candidatus Moranbacteria bacterium GW2011_GWE1_49_15]|nr:MAG: hypothetical protein UY41_C0057G0008 [Candidatus Moranbacteria bacterium GW2011_GWE1_49_15]
MYPIIVKTYIGVCELMPLDMPMQVHSFVEILYFKVGVFPAI